MTKQILFLCIGLLALGAVLYYAFEPTPSMQQGGKEMRTDSETSDVRSENVNAAVEMNNETKMIMEPTPSTAPRPMSKPQPMPAESTSLPPKTTSVTTVPPGKTTHRIAIRNYEFVPAAISIKVGDTVIWTNEDMASHTVEANDASFESALIRTGESYTRTFTAAGGAPYFCGPHPYMKASITIMQ